MQAASKRLAPITVGSVVIGYDGSTSGDLALRWAMCEGKLRSLPVHVMHIVQWPVSVIPGETEWLSAEQRAIIGKDIDEAIAAAGCARPEVSIVEGPVAGTLCDYSDQASMIVLGARGRGGFSGLLLGSVGLSVAVHAHCPVIVVRGQEHADLPDRHVAVGVDDSPQAVAAVDFALAEAASRGCAVVAVRAWQPPSNVREAGELEAAKHRTLHQILEQRRTRYPDVEVSTRLVCGPAAAMLVEASMQAQLIVVGARGRGGFAGLLLGSVGEQLLHHAECPVAIIR
ncbi:universal stress protein [Catelliglobosispora koreensis]|uniref:universal stress protein n=1 Tax=Catelliglobosispora koreensis TaxID=129052 RepID=UPI000377FA1D|nr:universal stress protein [Catelliglobosispora koreensis]